MKKNIPFLGVVMLIAAGYSIYYPLSNQSSVVNDMSVVVSQELGLTPQQLWEQEFARKKNRRENGYAKSDKPNEFSKYHEAIRTKWGEDSPSYPIGHKLYELNKAQFAARIANRRSQVLNWVERGPANVPGRTRSILVMPGDAEKNTWLAGSVAGGVWETTNGGLSWENKTNNLPNMATTSLVMSSSNPNVIYAGTGESFAGYNGVTGDGILKSVDGGENWIQLTATANNESFRNVNRLLINEQNHQVVLAATSPGYWGKASSKIMKSIDGGVSWYKVYDAGIDLQGNTLNIEQIIAHPSNFQVQYAAISGKGVMKSIDAGETWQKAAKLDAEGRIELAIAPQDPLRLYASVVGGVNGTGSDLYVSTDGALSWRLVTSLSGAKQYDYLGGQGWYDNTLAVNPFDKDEVYVAGVNMFRVRLGAEGTTTPTYLGVLENNTDGFLSFFSFGATYFNGQLMKGKAAEDKFTNIEVRFGSGRKQKAHRFTVRENSGTNSDGGAGVKASDFVYEDYVEVPFQVWDTDNNRQLMVSFRDQERDGVFNLNVRTISDEQLLDNREYLYIHSIPYSEQSNAAIGVAGGHEVEQLFFFWPTLKEGSTWSPNNLPQSEFIIQWGARQARDGAISVVTDAYGSLGGPNQYAQTTNSDATSGIHPDHHSILMVPVDVNAKTFKIINGNDGGVYVSKVSTEPGTKGGDWIFAGNGYNTTQLYGVDKKTGKNEYIFGSQDNGTWRTQEGQSADGSSKYVRALGGDGFEVLWHSDDSQKMMGSIYYNSIYRTLDGGKTWSAATTSLKDKGEEGDRAPFITKLASHKSRPDYVYAVGLQGVWRSEDFGGKWSVAPISEKWTIGSFTDIEVSIANPTIVWAGNGMSPTNSFHVSTDGGKTFAATTNYERLKLGVSTGIFTHATEDSTAYALFSFAKTPKILKTLDLGKTWEDITGFENGQASVNGFPDVAVYTMLVMPHNPKQIWVGTEIGLVESLDGGKTWSLANNGLPKVSIWDMKIVDNQVVIGTHARGVWTVDIEEIPVILRSPIVMAARGTEVGDLEISINLRSVYDSTQVFINNQYITTLPSSSNENVALALDGRNYVNKDLSISATGFVRGINYPGGLFMVKRGTLPLGFDEQVLAGELAFDAYPNPATAVANLRFHLVKPGRVSVQVLDISGKLLDDLDLGTKSVGKHTFPYVLPPALSNKIIILKLRTDTGVRTFKLLR